MRELSAKWGLFLLSAGVLCCYAAFQLGVQQQDSLVQEGVFSPGVQVYMVPQNAPQGTASQPAILQSMADVAMGTHGGGTNGMVTIPPQPPPTWTRGGNAWVYDSIYGTGRRPQTGVWGSGEFPESESEAAPAQVSPISAEPVVANIAAPAPSVIEQVVEPNGQKVDVAVPLSAAPAAAPSPAMGVPAVEDIVLPDGKQEQVIVPGAAPSPAAGPSSAPIEPAAGASVPAPAAEAQPAQPSVPSAASQPADASPQGCSSPGGCQTPVTMVMQAPAYSSPVTYVPSAPQYSQTPYSAGVSYVVPQQASQQLPMEWAAEDAAEHAYNLARWRVKILKAKMDQAKLRKQLMDETMGGLDGSSASEGTSGRAPAGRASLKAASSSSSPGANAAGGEVKELKQALLQLAEETADAIRGLHHELKAMRSKRKCCVKKASTTALAEVQTRKKSLQVEALKKRMDKQLDTLLKKVSNLIQKKQQ